MNPGARCRPSVLLVFLCLLSFPTGAQTVRVIDGDTLEIAGVVYRLHGIDAPEKRQQCNASDNKTWPCGKAATDKLIALIDRQSVICLGNKRDRYHRVIAVCYQGSINLSAEMVRSGHAWAYRRYSLDYLPQEQEARTYRLGIWQEATQTAQEHRSGLRGHMTQSKTKPPSEGCVIKGNISGNGRIYHMPGSPWYRRTKINQNKGERWFCTEFEARAAGWRKAHWS
ncbi:MAG: thermonuclease family protein [Cohaesibacter sp.]|nr:thermonuclease family protein [Cohaesibacter sp.]